MTAHPKNDVFIRAVREADTAGFLALKRIGLTNDAESFVGSLADDSPTYPEEVRHRLAKASIEIGDVIVGAFAPHLIGIIAITRDTRAKRQHKADLHGMYVVPEYRGRGLGRRLLATALEMARQMNGLEEIQLIVAAHSRSTVRLYEEFGFVSVWTELRALKLGYRYVDAHHMVLEMRASDRVSRTA
jgi:ribosomal protein S18 acetylase RimI-like enzyme